MFWALFLRVQCFYAGFGHITYQNVFTRELYCLQRNNAQADTRNTNVMINRLISCRINVVSTSEVHFTPYRIVMLLKISIETNLLIIPLFESSSLMNKFRDPFNIQIQNWTSIITLSRIPSEPQVFKRPVNHINVLQRHTHTHIPPNYERFSELNHILVE